MSEDNKGAPAPEQGNKPDPFAELKAANDQLMAELKNIKAEFNRKVENLRPTEPQVPKPQKKVSDLLYEDPDAAVALIEQQTEERITKKLDERHQSEYKRNTVLAEITSEFPEVSDAANPLTAKANEIFQKMAPEDRDNPISMKMAVAQAALELGVAPKSKRKAQQDEDDSFSLGGGQRSERGGNRRKKDDLPQETLEVAALMGLNTEDPKVVANLKKRAARNDWHKYKGE